MDEFLLVPQERGGGPPPQAVVEGEQAMTKSDHAYAKARRLRRQLTLPEVLLWQELRARPGALKFRRQHPAGPFVLDFYCPGAKLGIEVDGISHAMGDRPERDERRYDFLRTQGIAIIRIAAREVLASPVLAAEAIVALCRERGS